MMTAFERIRKADLGLSTKQLYKVLKLMREYGRDVSEETLKTSTKRAKIKYVPNDYWDGTFSSTSCHCIKTVPVVDEESILSTPIATP